MKTITKVTIEIPRDSVREDMIRYHTKEAEQYTEELSKERAVKEQIRLQSKIQVHKSMAEFWKSVKMVDHRNQNAEIAAE